MNGLLLRMAARNLLRNVRRTALTMLSIIAGLGIFVMGEAFVSGTEDNILVSAEEGLVGHVLVRPAGYPSQTLNTPIDKLLTVSPEAARLLDGEAVGWTGRVLFAPTVVHGAESIRVRGIGYEPATDEKVFPRHTWKVTGRLPADGADEITVAPSVARLLEVKAGDRVVLQVRTHHGALNALEVTVSGILASGNTALDSLGVLVPMALTKKLTQVDAPTHLSVRLRSRDGAPAFKDKLAAAMGATSEVSTVQEETADLIRLQGIRRKILDLIVFILLALAAFGMANTFLMAAYERTREVGTLRALGMTEGAVARLFLTEGAAVGLLGSLLGVAWGGFLAYWWSIHPLDISSMLDSTYNSRGTGGNVSFSALIYTHFNPVVGFWTVVVGVMVAIVASWYPARVASALRPADAVRA